MVDIRDHQPPGRSDQIPPMLEQELQMRRRAAVAEHARLSAEGAGAGLLSEQTAIIASVDDRLRGKRPRGQRAGTIVG